MMGRHRVGTLLVAAGWSTLAIAGVARAQGVDPNGQGRREQDVYLNDSFEAADALVRATRLTRAERWRDAAELLQKAADDAGDGLVRLGDRYYGSLRARISRTIAVWPARGLREYQAVVGDAFRRELSETRSDGGLDELLLLFDRYFCADDAPSLAEVIGQLAIETGDFSLARRVYTRVLDFHPQRKTVESRFLSMLAILDAMTGGLQDRVDALRDSTTVRWQGEDKTVGEVARHIRSTFRRPDRQAPREDWPTFGGSADRSGVGSCAVVELGLLWTSSLWSHAKDDRSGQSGNDKVASREQVRSLSIFPVASGQLVYIQHDREVVALYRRAGTLAWRYSPEGATAGEEDTDDQPAGWSSVTVADGRVFAALPGDTVPYYGYASPTSPPALICLDAQTGRLIWSLDQESSGSSLAEISFDSAPIVQRDHVYVVGRRRRSFGFEDCYLFRIKAYDGTVLSQTHLGSASTGTFGSRRATMAIAAVHGDTAYVCSNLGSLAAVSIHTGAVRWLRLYHRDAQDDSREWGWVARDIRPWAYNPVIAMGERLVAKPIDSSDILVLDIVDGRIVHTIATEVMGRAESLLGVKGDLLCTAGTQVACYDLAKEKLRWVKPLPEGQSLFGRGMWVGDRLLVPTRAGLSTFRVSDGSRSDAPWSGDVSGGNILALPEQLLVADADRLTVYVRKGELLDSLRAQMVASPSAPEPALDLAEVAFRNGDFDVALDALAQGVKRAGGFSVPLSTSLKRRIFDDGLAFASALDAGDRLTATVLDRLHSYVSQCPADVASHVSYRIRFAALYARRGAQDRALRLYHQILRDRSLRSLSLSDARLGNVKMSGMLAEEAGDGRAGSLAQQRIAALIDKAGLQIYAPYEQEAQRRLASAKAADDDHALEAIAGTFPNSRAAPEAVIAQAELHARANRHDAEATLLARVYHRYPSRPHRANLIRRVADAYEQAGRSDHAYRWLTKGMHEHPGFTFTWDGRSVDFREYRNRLADVRALIEPARPRLTLPLNATYSREITDRGRLLGPRRSDQPKTGWSNIFVQREGEIEALAATTGEQLWSSPVPGGDRATLLRATSAAVVFSTPHQIFALNPDGGQRFWLVGDRPKELDNVNDDWEDTGIIRQRAWRNDLLVIARDGGLMTAIDVGTGAVRWSNTQNPAPQGLVRVTDEWVVYHVSRDGKPTLCRVRADNGQWGGAAVIDERRSIEDFLVAIDGQVIVVTAQSLAGYELETGLRRWRVKLDGVLRTSSLRLDMDALFFSDDGRRARKISLEDGSLLFESEILLRDGDDDMTFDLQDGQLIASSRSSVAAIDAISGITLWRGTTPKHPHLDRRWITQKFVVAVHIPRNEDEPEATAFIYDHRNASGVLAKTLPLGKLENIRDILVADNAIVVQAGQTIHGWAHP